MRGRAGRPVRPSQTRDHRCRRRAGQVRRRPRVDRRLPRAWSATPPTVSPGSRDGARRAPALVLARYGHIENIPAAGRPMGRRPDCAARPKLSATLQAQLADALLFREIATVETDLDVGTVDAWQLGGPDRRVRRRRRRDRRARPGRLRRTPRDRRAEPRQDRPRPVGCETPPTEVTTRRSAAHRRCR